MAIVSTAFPQHSWLPWKFGHVPPNFWQNDDNCRTYLTWLSKELKFTSTEDWYNVTKFTFLKSFGTNIMDGGGSV